MIVGSAMSEEVDIDVDIDAASRPSCYLGYSRLSERQHV